MALDRIELQKKSAEVAGIVNSPRPDNEEIIAAHNDEKVPESVVPVGQPETSTPEISKTKGDLLFDHTVSPEDDMLSRLTRIDTEGTSDVSAEDNLDSSGSIKH